MTTSFLRNLAKNPTSQNAEARWAVLDSDRREEFILISEKVKAAQKRLDTYKNSNHYKKQIKTYVSNYMYSDIQAFEVVRTISDKTVEIRRMTATLQNKMEFVPGGFSANCTTNHNQKYAFESKETGETIKIRWSEKKGGWFNGGSLFVMENKPQEKYDFNF